MPVAAAAAERGQRQLSAQWERDLPRGSYGSVEGSRLEMVRSSDTFPAVAFGDGTAVGLADPARPWAQGEPQDRWACNGPGHHSEAQGIETWRQGATDGRTQKGGQLLAAAIRQHGGSSDDEDVDKIRNAWSFIDTN